MTFVTYGLTGHTLDAPIIFSSLQLFNVLRNPIVQLPMTLSSLMDAMAGIRTSSYRIGLQTLTEETGRIGELLRVCSVRVFSSNWS